MYHARLCPRDLSDLVFCLTKNWSGRPWRFSCPTPLLTHCTRPNTSPNCFPRIIQVVLLIGWSLKRGWSTPTHWSAAPTRWIPDSSSQHLESFPQEKKPGKESNMWLSSSWTNTGPSKDCYSFIGEDEIETAMMSICIVIATVRWLLYHRPSYHAHSKNDMKVPSNYVSSERTQLQKFGEIDELVKIKRSKDS